MLPVELLRRLRIFSLPLSFSAPSFTAGFSFALSLGLSSERSLRLVGEGALCKETNKYLVRKQRHNLV